MKKLFVLFVLPLVLLIVTSCQSLPKDPNSVVGSWEFVDTNLDIKSESAITDRIVRTAFAAYVTLGGAVDQFRGTVNFSKDGRCTAPKFSCEYTNYAHTLSLKYKLLDAVGLNTKFSVERRNNELYLTYDAKDAISQFGIGLDNKSLDAIERANIILVFRKK